MFKGGLGRKVRRHREHILDTVRNGLSNARIEAAKYPDVPYFVMGHSMGSFLTRTYIIRHPSGLKGAIISGTGQNPAAVVAAGKLMAKLEMIMGTP